VVMYEVPRVALLNAVEEGKTIAAEIIQLQMMLVNGYYTKEYVAERYEQLLVRVDAIQGRAEKAQKAVRELGPASLGPLPDEAMRGMAELRVLAAELKAGKEPEKVQEEIVRVNATLVGPAMTQWFESGVGKYNMVNDADARMKELTRLGLRCQLYQRPPHGFANSTPTPLTLLRLNQQVNGIYHACQRVRTSLLLQG